MKFEKLVNIYVLANLYYELIFLEEHGFDRGGRKFDDPGYVEHIISQLVAPRYAAMSSEAQTVIKKIGYYLASKAPEWDEWETIWQICSAPMETRSGVRDFMEKVYRVLFPNSTFPNQQEIAGFSVNNDPHVANRLN